MPNWRPKDKPAITPQEIQDRMTSGGELLRGGPGNFWGVWTHRRAWLFVLGKEVVPPAQNTVFYSLLYRGYLTTQSHLPDCPGSLEYYEWNDPPIPPVDKNRIV